MAERQADISVSIINTNNREVALACLESVYAQAGELALQVIVVNNACRDGSGEAIGARFPQVELIEQAEMRGFSTNNNLAFERATGRYLLMLNDDTLVRAGAFQKMVEFMDGHPEVGAVGPRLLNGDGSWQLSYGFRPHPIYEGLVPLSEMLHTLKEAKQPYLVENISGACMMVRRTAAQQVGYLDTRFDPLYSEEIDWCYRINQAGWKIMYIPSAEVVHLGGSTMRRSSTHRLIRISEKKAVFFRKHYGKGAVITFKSLLVVSNFLKAVFWGIAWRMGKSEASNEFKTHWELMKRAVYF